MEKSCKAELCGSESNTRFSQGKIKNKEINGHCFLGLGKFLRKKIHTIFGRRPKFSPAQELETANVEVEMLGTEIQQSPIKNEIQQFLIAFERDELVRATEGFSVQIGLGGYGIVYRGNLSDGRRVAVKVLDKESFQGKEEWRNELNILSKLDHRNISKLVGYCCEDNMIVYECMARSLSSALFGKDNEMVIDWTTRFKIILDIIRGLAYLHEGTGVPIMHKDVKPSDILLDESFNAKISDFGYAMADIKLPWYEDVSIEGTRVVRTYGYAAPEYIATGTPRMKSDIYGFGVTVLNVVSGKQAIDNKNFLSENARRLHDKRRLTELIDPRLLNAGYSTHSKSIAGTINIALQCTVSNARSRPSASRVLEMLLSKDPNRHNTGQC
ncbi:putative serine/threonine-protein kinase [Cryptomeria japonica]|uniref:putative serine/threonine-protein kinase n=1 Tax=Cryptomeria japonica TaxID=3369 RepID=UPI0027D9F721|nr:putative serine/threonine-protein kinase [Cryptomeria japonica]